MDVQELIKQEYKAVFGLNNNFNEFNSEPYKKQAKSCNKKKINQNSIEMYQAEQKLKMTFNSPFISTDEYIKSPIDSYLPNMNNSYLFKSMKKELFTKNKNSEKSDRYISNILDKYKLLLLQAIESDNKNKVIILYYAAKQIDKNFILPKKAFKYFIQEES